VLSSTDLPLTDKGIRQAEATKNYLNDLLGPSGFRHVYSSPLLRARQTAAIIAGDMAAIEECRELREMELGLIEGLTWEEKATLYPGVNFEDRLSRISIPGGEAFGDVKARALGFMERLCPDDEGDVLVVSHGITIRVLVNCLLGKEDHCVDRLHWADNASVTEIVVKPPSDAALKRLNHRGHLTALGLGNEDYEKWGLFAQEDYMGDAGIRAGEGD